MNGKCGPVLGIIVFALALGTLTLAGCKDSTAPEDITNLSAYPGDGEVTLEWTPSANTEGDLAGYALYRDGARVGTVSAAATGATIPGLANGTSYALRVAAYDEVPNESPGAAVNAYANAPLTPENFNAESGIADGVASVEATQRMRGTLPNPTDSDTDFGGSAFLVINGNRIPLDVTPVAVKGAGGTIYKEGVAYPAVDADWMSPDFDWLAAKQGGVQWIFQVTFSINAGPNTLKIEVYDLDDSLYASTDSWDIIGAIEPVSMVVTLWWNTNLTDIDLHASPDDGATHCYYRSMRAGEMVLDYDDTNGYGPEHITVDNATTTATYKIKVYYYADHNDTDPPITTPTTCFINAQVNGETKLDASSTLSSESSSSGWGGGAHVWDAGEVEVKAANRLNVTLGAPDLSSYPEVSLAVTILNPADENRGVPGLNSNNIFVINAGTAMRPVTVTGGAGGAYTLTFNDITAGRRNLYVYVHAPVPDEDKAEDDSPFMGGLSNTVTYGTNYVLLVGLNEYPPAATTLTNWWNDDPNNFEFDVKPKVPSSQVGMPPAGDFTVTIKDVNGGTNRPDIVATASSIVGLVGGGYRLTVPKPAANAADYDRASVKYKKQAWLSNSINDINDMRASLLNVGTGASNTMWSAANIKTLTDAAATKAAMLDAIEDIALDMEPWDAFLFCYSGHGSNGDADANQYLCTYEDDAWTSVTALKGALDWIPDPGFPNTFLVMDACYSGNFIDMKSLEEAGAESGNTLKWREFLPQAEPAEKYGAAFKGLTGDNLFVMTAVDGNHPAWDVGALQNGVFIYYLVEGMDVAGKYVSAAVGNKNNDVWITGEEAFTYAKPKAKKYVEDNILPTNPGSLEDPQVYPNTNGKSRLIYNW